MTVTRHTSNLESERDGTGVGSPAEEAGAKRSFWPPISLLAWGVLGALVTTGVIVAIHRESLRTLISAHGLLHVAIAQRFLEVGVPNVPENPFFAGEPLPYYWFFHYCAARVSSWLGVHPLFGFELLIIGAAWIFWLGGVTLGHQIYHRRIGGFAVAWLAFAGANALGVPLLLFRLTALGDSLPADHGQFLWGIAHPFLGRLGLGDPYALHQPLLFFFFNVTSRPVALAFLLLAALALFRWQQSGSWKALAGVAAAMMACALFSPLIGLAAGGSLAASFFLVYAVRSERASRAQMLLTPLALLTGVLLAAPTFVQLFKISGGDTLTFGIDRTLLAVCANAAVLYALALVAIRRTEGARRSYLLALTAAATVLLLAAGLARLPATNESNFYHAGILLLAVPAAGAFVPSATWSASKARLAAAALLVFLPSTAAVAAAFWHRPDVALEIRGRDLVRKPAASGPAQTYRWIAQETETNAVFITDPRPPLVVATGNMPEFPALTGRTLFIGLETSYVVTPHKDVTLRHAIALDALEGRSLGQAQQDYLKKLGRPVYLVSNKAANLSVSEKLQSQLGRPAFQQGEFAIYRLQ